MLVIFELVTSTITQKGLTPSPISLTTHSTPTLNISHTEKRLPTFLNATLDSMGQNLSKVLRPCWSPYNVQLSAPTLSSRFSVIHDTLH
jgi:hypothetical protein